MKKQFSNQDLKNLIVPLFLEQLLVALVGMADVFVIGFVGEAAVSGVSLVNSFNTIFLNLFTALAAGGAVVISQYIGREEKELASRSACQLALAAALFSIAAAVLILLNCEPLLQLLFGKVEPEVMAACITYLKISAYSYPALAVYNAGAALYRSFGKTSTTMYISIASNYINVVGNCIGVFVLKAGVAGVAWPSLAARTFSAVAITVLCFSKKNPVSYCWQGLLRLEGSLQAKILRIAVPNGFESGIFQLVKVALSSVISMFGTYQIAANGVAQSFWSMAALVCVAMGPVFITVIGQCMGAGDIEAAEYYFHKLIKITILFSTLWNAVILVLTPMILHIYTLESETKKLVFWLVVIHNVFCSVILPLADSLGKGLRACGDVGFTTGISLFTTIGVRLVFSMLFAVVWKMGVIGIAFAMCLDWSMRGIIFWFRFKQGRWKRLKVI